jgi:hypothetical protein
MVTLTFVTTPVRPETLMLDGYGEPGPETSVSGRAMAEEFEKLAAWAIGGAATLGSRTDSIPKMATAWTLKRVRRDLAQRQIREA